MNLWSLLMAGMASMILIFSLAWWWGLKIRNYSLVDAVWAFSIGVTGVAWLLSKGIDHPKWWVAALLLATWSLRLGSHLQKRIRKAHPEEDARYVKLREVWNGRENSAFFWFFQGQALSVILLALPFLLIVTDADSSWSAWETVGATIAFIGICGEGVADSQMARFKRNNSDRKAVCREGLWNYSRHPNYFFESIIWSGFYIYACGSDWGWAMIHAPAIITFLVLKVTGIPPTEAAAVASKGDAYRDYQRTTSSFIPLPPKADTHQKNHDHYR